MVAEALQRLKDAFDPQEVAEANEGSFTSAWFKSLEIVDAEQPTATTSKIVYRFPVLNEYLNPMYEFTAIRTTLVLRLTWIKGGLHGGATATIFDVATTFLLALINRPGFWWPTMGTTRALNCTYFRPAFEGEIIRLECETVHVGKRLASLKGVMKRDNDGAIIASCEHDKYNVDADTKI